MKRDLLRLLLVWFLSRPDVQGQNPLSAPPSPSSTPPSGRVSLAPLPPRPTRPRCLWRVIDFLSAPEKRAASARLEVTHFPGAFSSLLIKPSPGSTLSLLIHSAIRATPPLRTPSMGGWAGGWARLAEEHRSIFCSTLQLPPSSPLSFFFSSPPPSSPPLHR